MSRQRILTPLSALFSICLLVSAAALPAKDRNDGPTGRATTKTEESSKKPEGDSFAVIQVGDEIKVVTSSALEATQKDQNAKYQEEIKAYNDARKAAGKAKQPFAKPRPVAPSLRVLARNLKSEADARVQRDKFAANPKTAAASTPGELFAVVDMGSEVKVMRSAELEAKQKEENAKHQEQMKAYNEARKAAARAKQEFNKPKPPAPALKVLARNLKSEAAASAELEKIIARKTKAQKNG